jgi:hypothetical protein
MGTQQNAQLNTMRQFNSIYFDSTPCLFTLWAGQPMASYRVSTNANNCNMSTQAKTKHISLGFQFPKVRYKNARYVFADWCAVETHTAEGQQLEEQAKYNEVTITHVVFWDATSCGSCKSRRFGGTYRLHRQGEKSRPPWWWWYVRSKRQFLQEPQR